MKSKANIVMGTFSALLWAVLLFMVKTFDVKAIGPNGTSIGFSKINKAVFQSLGQNDIWYKVTEVMGIAALGLAAFVGLIGLIQLIQRKSLFKVDASIYATGGLYAIVIGLYVLFDKVAINYRPIIEEGCTEPEASFPSSHTLLAFVVFGSVIVLLNRYIKDGLLKDALKVVCELLIVVVVVGRLLSGVHWFTDILAGTLLSFALLGWYAGIEKICNKKCSGSEE